MRNSIREHPYRPTVSFVMATHNRGAVMVDCLRRTVACAEAALGKGRFGVVVVDNASSDGTAERVEAAARELNLAVAEGQRNGVVGAAGIRVVRLKKNWGPVVKNLGLQADAADIVVLLDDDAYPLPGALAQMVRHFQDDARLGAAVFDVSLPNGAKEASAYTDVFIGAGTALRGSALLELENEACGRGGGGLLPWRYFMQAEEYHLSFRFLAAGWTVQRFWDMPLMHLKTPGARIGERTTRLDVRNNLWLLAEFVPAPLCRELAADWLARYWRMAEARDSETQNAKLKTQNEKGEASSARVREHRKAFILGAAEGLRRWKQQRGDGGRILPAELLEKIFKFQAIHERLARAKEEQGLRRIAFGDWGKNILAFWKAARELNLEVAAVVDGRLSGTKPAEYRGIPVIDETTFRERYERDGVGSVQGVDAVVITAISPVHAGKRGAELRRILRTPVVDLFSRGMGSGKAGAGERALQVQAAG